MIVKDLFGNYAEAFNLIMRKEYAYQILKGEKKIEFRDLFSDYFCSMFFKESKDKKSPDYFVPRDIGCIHFHDYNNTWFLDVSIEAVDINAIHPDNADYFHKYGHHEFDKAFAAIKEANIDAHDKQIDWYITMPITGIINTNLDLSALPEGSVTAYSIPEDLILTKEEARIKIAEKKKKSKKK